MSQMKVQLEKISATDWKFAHPALEMVRHYSPALVIALLFWLSKPTPLSVLLGSIPLVIGQIFNTWAVGHLVKSVKLITSGPYAHVQNPLYFGRLMMLTGFCLMARMDYFINLWLLLIGCAYFFYYYFPRKLRIEGNRLRRFHGEIWERYYASVPKLFPSFRAYPGSTQRWSWQLAIRSREYLVILGLILVIILFAYKVQNPAG